MYRLAAPVGFVLAAFNQALLFKLVQDMHQGWPFDTDKARQGLLLLAIGAPLQVH